MIFFQSLRMLWRDWRAGEIHFMLMALVIAVGALSATNFFVYRLEAALESNSHQLLGGDLAVIGDQLLDSAWRAEAEREGLQIATTAVFPSMAIAGAGDQTRSRLAALKAVSALYPLRGKIRLQDDLKGPVTIAEAGPGAGRVWVDPGILTGLQVHIGDPVKLGDKTFTIEHVISVEPDRGAGMVNLAPRVMLSADDLGATGLVQDGSRVTYRLLLAGNSASLNRFQQWFEKRLQQMPVRGVQLQNAENGSPELQATLQRARQFLSLVSVMAALLAAIAIAMTARRYMVRHLDACAIMRCLGMTQNQLVLLHFIEFFLVALIGSVAGVAIGYGAHEVLVRLLAGFIQTDLPPAGWQPFAQGIVSGILLLVGFIMPPILQLRNVPHNRVIRRDQGAPKPTVWAVYGLGACMLMALLLWQTDNLTIGLTAAGGFLLSAALFAGVVWLALLGLARLRRSLPPGAVSFGLQALHRRVGGTIVQTVALSLGLMALLLLTVVRGQLINQWQGSTPADAPNRFVINIQDDQRTAFTQQLTAAGVQPTELYPMIRGRLIQVDGRPVSARDYREGRAQRLVEREFNISALDHLPSHNNLVAGNWFHAAGKGNGAEREASVEEGLAQTLNLHLGDHLLFDVGGQNVPATITSLRKLDWSSMQVNFFVILSPAGLDDVPRTWITAFRANPKQPEVDNRLSENFPNLTVIDISNLLNQVQLIVSQVSGAVQFLFLFALAAGILVLYAAVVATQQERQQEAGLLRALGANRALLRRAQWMEFCFIGAMAGLMAATGAAVIGWTLAIRVFHFAWFFSPWAWVLGAAAGMICTMSGGFLALRKLLSTPPAQTLREAI